MGKHAIKSVKLICVRLYAFQIRGKVRKVPSFHCQEHIENIENQAIEVLCESIKIIEIPVNGGRKGFSVEVSLFDRGLLYATN